jgi:AraC-like DNA-binding protein
MITRESIQHIPASVDRAASRSVRSAGPGKQVSVWVLTERCDVFGEMLAALRSQLLDVRIVTDGWQTYDEALMAPPNVIVIDGALRCMDANAFCSLMRGTAWLARVPLVFIETGLSSDARTRAFVAGASDCIAYPFFAEELVARLRLQVRIARQSGLVSEGTRQETQSTISRATQFAIDLIKGENLARWNVKSLARRVGVSERRLTDQFKAALGVSVTDYLRIARMERGAWLIRNTGVAVSAVAREVGFRSPCNFSVAFKKHTGMSPSAFRDKEVPTP